MKLKDYREREEMSQETLARELDVWPSHISRIEGGQTRPSWFMMQMVMDFTDGDVEPNDWFDIK